MAAGDPAMTVGPAEVMYGTPEEVRSRLEHGIAPTMSSFTQIKHSVDRSPSIREIDGKVVRNGVMGKDLNHSAS